MSPDRGQLYNSFPFPSADAPPPLLFAMEEEATPAGNMMGAATRKLRQPAAIVIPRERQNQVQSVSQGPESASPNGRTGSSAQLSGSLHSSSTHSLSHTSNTTSSRRNSGFSTKRRGSSRSSSKHSIPSPRDFSSGDDSSYRALPSRQPHPRRAMSTSRVPTSYQLASVEGTLALHERSVQLFGQTSPYSQVSVQGNSFERQNGSSTLSRSPSSQQTNQLSISLPSSLVSRADSVHRSRRARLGRTVTSPPALPIYLPQPIVPRTQSVTAISTSEDHDSSYEYDESFVPATVMHWTSNETRRREYDAIDRQSRGIRGLWNKIRPRMFKGKHSSQRGFYDPENNADDDDDDAGSVRRYRLQLEDE
jgi:hypothetical protein